MLVTGAVLLFTGGVLVGAALTIRRDTTVRPVFTPARDDITVHPASPGTSTTAHALTRPRRYNG